jgi:hypothetical protein
MMDLGCEPTLDLRHIANQGVEIIYQGPRKAWARLFDQPLSQLIGQDS